MATTKQKTNFRFIGVQSKPTQQQYNNLIEHTSYQKFQTCITKIKQDLLNPEITEKHSNKQKPEKIQELETQLTKYKEKTTTLMGTTAMILHKKYKTNQKKT